MGLHIEEMNFKMILHDLIVKTKINLLYLYYTCGWFKNANKEKYTTMKAKKT